MGPDSDVEIATRKRPACHREPLDERALLGRQLVEAVGDELLERRGKRHGWLPGALDLHELLPVIGAFANLELPTLEQCVDHLEQEERIAGGTRHEIGASLGDARRDAEARLQEPDLVLAAEALEIDAHQPVDGARRALVGARREEREHGQRVALAQEIRERLEALTVAPLHAVEHGDERPRLRRHGDEAAQRESDHLSHAGGVGVGVVSGFTHVPRAELGDERRDFERLVVLGIAKRAHDEGDGFVERLIDMGVGELAEPVAHGGVRHLAERRRALDADETRVGWQVRKERRDERRLADAHLTVHDARGDPGWRLLGADRPVVGRVQVRELGVAAHEVARQGLQCLEPLLARVGPEQRVNAEVWGQAEPLVLGNLHGGRVAPHEVSTHEAVEPARDPAHAGRRLLTEQVRQMIGGLLKLVLDEVPCLVALARGDAADDADARRQSHGQILGAAAHDLVHVDGEPDRVGGRPRGVRHEAHDGARRRGRSRGRGLPRPARTAAEGRFAERRLELGEHAHRLRLAQRFRELLQPMDLHRHDGHVADLAIRALAPLLAGSARARPLVGARVGRRGALRLQDGKPDVGLAAELALVQLLVALRLDGGHLLVAHEVGNHRLEHVGVHELLALEQGPADAARQVARRFEAIFGNFRERAHRDFLELARQLAHERARRLDDARPHEVEQLRPLGGTVQRTTREQLVEDHAEGIDVGATRHLLATGLLGRHVRGLALEHAGLLAKQIRGGDAEIGYFDGPIERQEDVLRGDVAVHDVERSAGFVLALVGVMQALGDLGHDVRRDERRDAAILSLREPHQPLEVGTLDELHAEELPLVAVVLKVVDLDDVRVVEARGKLRLLGEHAPKAA